MELLAVDCVGEIEVFELAGGALHQSQQFLGGLFRNKVIGDIQSLEIGAVLMQFPKNRFRGTLIHPILKTIKRL